MRLGGDTDFHVTRFVSPSNVCSFSYFFIFLATRSVAMALVVLRCMNQAISTMKAFVHSSFLPTWSTGVAGVGKFCDWFDENLFHHFPAQELEKALARDDLSERANYCTRFFVRALQNAVQ